MSDRHMQIGRKTPVKAYAHLAPVPLAFQKLTNQNIPSDAAINEFVRDLLRQTLILVPNLRFNPFAFYPEEWRDEKHHSVEVTRIYLHVDALVGFMQYLLTHAKLSEENQDFRWQTRFPAFDKVDFSALLAAVHPERVRKLLLEDLVSGISSLSSLATHVGRRLDQRRRATSRLERSALSAQRLGQERPDLRDLRGAPRQEEPQSLSSERERGSELPLLRGQSVARAATESTL